MQLVSTLDLAGNPIVGVSSLSFDAATTLTSHNRVASIEVAAGLETVAISFTTGPGPALFRGLMLTGSTDASITVEFNTVRKYSDGIHILKQTAFLNLPNPESLAADTLVTVWVQNRSNFAGVFVATLLFDD